MTPSKKTLFRNSDGSVIWWSIEDDLGNVLAESDWDDIVSLQGSFGLRKIVKGAVIEMCKTHRVEIDEGAPLFELGARKG